MTGIRKSATSINLINQLNRHKKDELDSLNSLVSGTKNLTKNPVDIGRSVAIESRLRSIVAEKRNIHEGISFLQTAESSLSKVNNVVTRMKELNLAAASTTISPKDRRFIFQEFQELHQEVDRIVESTEYNGVAMLSDKVSSLSELAFLIGDPLLDKDGQVNLKENANFLRIGNVSDIHSSTKALKLPSAEDLLDGTEEEGIELEGVEELLLAEEDGFSTVYDEVLERVSSRRTLLGSFQSRLNHSLELADVSQENIAATQSRIVDVDYAEESTNLVKAKMLINTATSLLTQNQVDMGRAFQLISGT